MIMSRRLTTSAGGDSLYSLLGIKESHTVGIQLHAVGNITYGASDGFGFPLDAGAISDVLPAMNTKDLYVAGAATQVDVLLFF